MSNSVLRRGTFGAIFLQHGGCQILCAFIVYLLLFIAGIPTSQRTQQQLRLEELELSNIRKLQSIGQKSMRRQNLWQELCVEKWKKNIKLQETENSKEQLLLMEKFKSSFIRENNSMHDNINKESTL